MAAWAVLPDLGWAVVNTVPARVAFAPLGAFTQGSLLTAVGLVVVMGGIGVVVARRISRPIGRLAAAARAIGSGDLSPRITLRTGDEIERLANEFNRMAEAVAQNRERLDAGALELERTVGERTQALHALEAANRELEAFSYSVSHDLRAPLRAINAFSAILRDRHAAQLPDEAQRYLRIVSDNARQMGQLIDDLLAMSRLGRQAIHPRTVAPADLVREVLAELRTLDEDRRVDIHIQALPPCQADPGLLKQVFVNLLDNALKFTRRREDARIEIGCTEVDGIRTYFVRDNGAGFDMLYTHKLFSVFQRLHSTAEYEGTGVGLAIVQRVIQRHGGRVWAEAAVDQGATFFFTLEGARRHD